jgi:hypothetical protein
MEKKMMYALVAVVVIIVVAVAVAGAYVLMNSGGGGGGGNTYTVANATSLQYDTDVTYQGDITHFKWAAKNVGATDMVLRLDILHGEQGNYTYILNGGDQTAWVAVNGTWTDYSSDFTNQWNLWMGTGKQWTGNMNALANWSGTGDYTYTGSTTNSTIRIYNIAINPTLADSLFQPNT